MELIVINESKLKIMMSREDMDLYGLDENEFHCSVINARAMLEKILHSSPVCTGFENIPPEDRILIQLYPIKSGGCELYVTKLTLDEKEVDAFMSQENEAKYLLPKPITKAPFLTYRFEDLEHAISAAREISRCLYNGQSSFYKSFEGKYVLSVNSQRKNLLCALDFLSEFGEQINAENTYMQLLERGTCIFKENAIEKLSKI